MGHVRRLLFRCGLIYFVLYALPFPLREISELLNRSWTLLFENQPLPGVLKEMARWPPDIAGFWRETVEMVSGWEWWPFEVVAQQRTGSGDTAAAWSRLLVSLVFALLLGILWSVLDRRPRRYRGLCRWTHLGVRWYTGTVILGYGLAKVYASQMGDVSLSTLMKPFGDKSPMGLVWSFMGHSEPYECFSGLMEALGAMLLFWRGTSLLGCMVLIPTMTNVTLLNWMYDVPVKLFSTHLLLFTCVLLIPELGRLWSFFVRNQVAQPADHRLVDSRVLRIVLLVLGCTVGFAYLLDRHEGFVKRRESFLERRAQRPAEYGVYRVAEMKVDGEVVPRSDVTRWKWFAIDNNGMAWSEEIGGRRQYLYFARAEESGELRVGRFMGFDARRNPRVPANTEVWTLRVGTEEVEGPVRAPRTRADFSRREKALHSTVDLAGTYRGKRYELHLVEKYFELQRGFHLVQEYPHNR